MADDFGVFAAFRSMVQPGGHDLGWLVDDVQRHIATELDFRNEARHAAACRAALAWRAGRVRVPLTVSKLCSARVVTTELIEGCVRVDGLPAPPTPPPPFVARPAIVKRRPAGPRAPSRHAPRATRPVTSAQTRRGCGGWGSTRPRRAS